ncbi:MAG: tyrosine-type recombinase/integrase [Heyndrickxia sp.]
MKGYYRQKGKGWQFTIDIGKDPVTGKRKQMSKGGFKSEKEAQKAARELMVAMDQGTNLLKGKVTFKSFFQKWFYNQYRNQVDETTFETRKYSFENHIIPYFGDKLLRDIKVYDIDVFYNQKVQEGIKPATIGIFRSILNCGFEQAIIWDVMKTNPVRKAKPPRIEDKDVVTWSVKEVEHFLNVAREEGKHLPFFISLFTGLRKGEVLGLKWADIDFENKKIHLVRSLARVNNRLIFKKVKTKRSKRPIAVSEGFLDILLDARQRQQQLKESLGEAFDDQDLVVCTMYGTPMDPRNILRQLASLSKKANVPYIAFHDLRHTHATLLLEKDIHPKIVAERLGHSRIQITLDRYSHVTPDMQEKAATALDDTISSIA